MDFVWEVVQLTNIIRIKRQEYVHYVILNAKDVVEVAKINALHVLLRHIYITINAYLYARINIYFKIYKLTQ